MTSRTPRSVSTPALALVLATAATRWLLEATEPLRHPASSRYDDLLLALAAWVLLGCGAWAVVIGIAAAVEATSAGRLPATAWVGCPRSLRRLLLTGLGVALVGAGPLQSSATASAKAPLPVPARPVGATHPDGQAGTHSEDTHAVPLPGLVVRPGDSLWRIAEQRLHSSASADEVAALVHRLHHRNRGVIGPDPDLIRPGQRLAVPPPGQRSWLNQPTHGR
jgi:LysM domain